MHRQHREEHLHPLPQRGAVRRRPGARAEALGDGPGRHAPARDADDPAAWHRRRGRGGRQPGLQHPRAVAALVGLRHPRRAGLQHPGAVALQLVVDLVRGDRHADGRADGRALRLAAELDLDRGVSLGAGAGAVAPGSGPADPQHAAVARGRRRRDRRRRGDARRLRLPLHPAPRRGRGPRAGRRLRRERPRPAGAEGAAGGRHRGLESAVPEGPPRQEGGDARRRDRLDQWLQRRREHAAGVPAQLPPEDPGHALGPGAGLRRPGSRARAEPRDRPGGAGEPWLLGQVQGAERAPRRVPDPGEESDRGAPGAPPRAPGGAGAGGLTPLTAPAILVRPRGPPWGCHGGPLHEQTAISISPSSALLSNFCGPADLGGSRIPAPPPQGARCSRFSFRVPGGRDWPPGRPPPPPGDPMHSLASHVQTPACC
mmetsp:Transcript_14439/g.43213  ORF Transcript_14439/g.43213 Transcript_14439/m.43213 type:complete len:428 (-) Transcript_14439:67-1350(-)